MDKQLKDSLVSIIVPCYNYGHFLSDTIKSIRSQTYNNWECIIIDDGSIDNTKEVAENFCILDDRIKYIYQSNQGLSSARNTGINSAKGEYIQLLDADDLIEKDKFRTQIEVFKQHTNADIVYGDCFFFTTENVKLRMLSMAWHEKQMLVKIFGKNDIAIKAFLSKNIMPVNCSLIKKSVFEIVPSFNINLKFLEDWEYWFRCSIAGIYFHYQHTPNSAALIRTHPNSMSKDYWKMGYSELMLRYYFETNLTNNLHIKLNENEIKNNKKRLLRIILFELLVKKNTHTLQKLKLIFDETNIFRIIKKMIIEKIYPDISLKMIVHFIKFKIIK